MTVRTWKTGIVLGAMALLTIAIPAHAQENIDGRWLAFVGCWEPVNGEDDAGLLCFSPSDGGLEMQNIVAGEVVATEHLVADGQLRPVSAAGCEASESLEFSEDGRRVFTRSEFVCGGDLARSGTGIMSFVAPNRWIDVRALDVEGEVVAWVQEYAMVGPARLAEEGVSDPSQGFGVGVRVGRMVAASTAIDLDDVEEAVAHMDAKAVETWIAAQRDPFDLRAEDLLRLSDNGVPGSVIDVVVAVSYPDKFVVEPSSPIEQTRGDRRVGDAAYRGYGGYNPYYGGVGYSRYGFGYSSFGYSPFGFSSLGFYGGGFGGGYPGYRPTTVIIDRRGGSDGGGRIQNGRGYTTGSSGSSGRVAQPRSPSSRPAASVGSGSQSGSSAGSSGGTGSAPRKAKRRRTGG